MPTVVPFSAAPAIRPQQAAPLPDETFMMMAAATMHKEGRLVEAGQYGEPATTGGPTQQQPPQKYFPSDGDRSGPSMMT